MTVRTVPSPLPTFPPVLGQSVCDPGLSFPPSSLSNRTRAQGMPGSALPCLLGLCYSRVDCPGCPTPAGFLRPMLPQSEEGLSRVREENLPRTLESKEPQILWVTQPPLSVFSGHRSVQCGLINLFNTVLAHFWPHLARFYPIALTTILSSFYVNSLTIEAGRRHTSLF